MTKKSIISTAIKMIYFLIILIIVEGIALIRFMFYGSELKYMSLLVVVGIVLALACWIINSKILKPYHELAVVYEKFYNGEVYEELFDLKYMVMPNWDKVIQRMKHLLNKQDAIKMSEKQAEYLALQNQINPHFLYNTLEAIRGDAICAKMYGIAETTEALSVFFRYSITGVDKLVSIEEEINNVENYFKIQYYRFGDKIKLYLKNTSSDEVKQLLIPKLTIQPFVENAIFHGLEKRVAGGLVQIKIELTEKQVIVTISDNGIGMKEEEAEKVNLYFEKVAVSYVGESKTKNRGIGMKNVNSRIKLLFGEDYGITVYSVENIGTDIRVKLPKIRQGEYEKRNITN